MKLPVLVLSIFISGVFHISPIIYSLADSADSQYCELGGDKNCENEDESSVFTKVTKIVSTNSGKLRGKLELSRNGGGHFAFLGIPYANPPTRFEVSTPVTPWEDVRNALDYGSICPQIDAFIGGPDTVLGDENCLFLNVYTPSEERCHAAGALPVLFHIHGGAYLQGSGELYSPKYLMDHCIVYVSINYRLGPLGFLTTEDDVIPGNLGLKDALLALKWTRENIEFFNGDKNSITLNGISAGGASVMHFIASPAAKGLFHRAIAQSGSALAPWAMENHAKDRALQLGQLVGCNFKLTRDLKKCLDDVNYVELVKKEELIKDWLMKSMVFGPVVEPPDAIEPFQTEHPYLRLKRGDGSHVPLMTGVMKDEGILINGAEILNREDVLNDLNNNWDQAAPFLYLLNKLDIPKDFYNVISNKIRRFYFGNKEINSTTKQAVYDSMSDILFDYWIYEHSELHSKYAPVYHYVMTFESNVSIIQPAFKVKETAVTHADDGPYLFNFYEGIIPGPEPLSERLRFSENLVKLWVSFIETGTPTDIWPYVDDWKRFTADDPFTLKLDIRTEGLKQFRQERMNFWKSLHFRDLQFPGL